MERGLPGHTQMRPFPGAGDLLLRPVLPRVPGALPTDLAVRCFAASALPPSQLPEFLGPKEGCDDDSISVGT